MGTDHFQKGSNERSVHEQNGAHPAWLVPAGFWVRFIAYVIDSAIIGALQLVSFIFLIGGSLSLLLSGASMKSSFSLESALFSVLGAILIASLGTLYHAVFEASSLRASPAKKLLGLSVYQSNRERVGFGRALSRNLLKALCWFPLLGTGFLLAAVTSEKQGIHDLLSRSVVLREVRTPIVRLLLGVLIAAAICYSLPLQEIKIPDKLFPKYLSKVQSKRKIIIPSNEGYRVIDPASNSNSPASRGSSELLPSASTDDFRLDSFVTINGTRVEFNDSVAFLDPLHRQVTVALFRTTMDPEIKSSLENDGKLRDLQPDVMLTIAYRRPGLQFTNQDFSHFVLAFYGERLGFTTPHGKIEFARTPSGSSNSDKILLSGSRVPRGNIKINIAGKGAGPGDNSFEWNLIVDTILLSAQTQSQGTGDL